MKTNKKKWKLPESSVGTENNVKKKIRKVLILNFITAKEALGKHDATE